MKPDWSKAPDWAQWFAMDEEGTGYWYQHQPSRTDFGRWVVTSPTPFGQSACAPSGDNQKWYDSLEQRPTRATEAELAAFALANAQAIWRYGVIDDVVDSITEDCRKRRNESENL